MRALSPLALRSARLLTVAVLAVAALIAGPASAAALKQDAQPVADTSCGSVVVEGSITYKLTIAKGSPSCSTVRRIVKRFGHPISKKPRFNCGNKGYECEYSIYPEGWRCGGLFEGNFECWHGANSPARADEAFYGSEDRSAEALRGKPRESLEFYAEEPGARDKLECAIYADQGEANCESFPPREGRATVDADGKVSLCRAPRGEAVCAIGNVGEGAPTLRVGHHVNVGVFRCSVLRGGVKCLVRATGKGFLFSSRTERAVGGASVERTGRRTRMSVSGRRLLGRSCGIVRIDKDEKARLTITLGTPACKEVRAIAKDYDHPKEARAYCHPVDHLCEYGVYPRGWRCGGLFQGNFGCWLGGDVRGRGARAGFGGTLVYTPTPRALREDRRRRAPCTKKAIKAGLGQDNGRLLTGTSFKCAGRFAYADVKIADYEAVQLLRSYGRHWKVVDRGKYCEAGLVPAKIRYFACEVS